MKTLIDKLSTYGMILFAAFAMAACSGEDGAPGPEGPQGPIGPQGAQGPAGADGTDGANGANGADGADGNSYEDYFNDFEAFTAPGMEFYGDATWFVGDKDLTPGVSDKDINTALLTGDISDNQIVGLSMALSAEIDMVVEFDAWISSEANYDYLIWYINDTQVNGISGSGGPFHFTFHVPAGTDSIAWEYDKDGIFSSGSDNAHIDNVRITNYAPSGRYDFGNPEVSESVKFLSDQLFKED